MIALAVLIASSAWAAPRDYGVLLLAHGGAPAWNAQAEAIAAAVAKRAPAALALGMADPASIQKAIDALAAKKVKRVVAVPLFVHSSSEVLEHTRFILGLAPAPSAVFREAMASMPHAHHGAGHGGYSEERVALAMPISMTPALDDDALVSGILLARAKALSRDPSRETVFLVGHGPVDEKANARWLETMGRLGDRLRRAGGFLEVRSATIRDDSPQAVKAEAIARLRASIERASKGSRVLVVPHLISRGGIEAHVRQAVDGLPVAWSGDTLAPHPDLARWVLKRAQSAR